MTEQKKDRLKQNWGSRSWKWLVPSILIIIILGLLGFFASIMLLMKSSKAYKEAMAKVRDSSEVQEALGTPIDDDFFFWGGVSVSSEGTGNAWFTICVEGPEGSAEVIVESVKQDDWHFQLLEVKAKSGKTINLLDSKKNY